MDLTELIAERDIYRQLVKFARAMDNKDWQTLKTITSAHLKANLGSGEITGNTEVIAFIRSFLDNCGATQHMLGNIVIDVQGDTATSQSYVSDMHLSKDQASDTHFRTLGDYSDKWSKINGTWVMTHRVKNNRATLGSLDIFKP